MALLEAAAGTNVDAVHALLDAGADPNARNDDGKSALHFAVNFRTFQKHRNSQRRMLREWGVGEEPMQSQNWFAREHRLADDALSIIALLAGAGGDPNSRAKKNGATPLYQALSSKIDAKAVSALLDAGADPDLHGEGGRTALHQAVGGNAWDNGADLEIVRALIAAGADVNARDEDGLPPLFLAAMNKNSIPVINALIEAGADPKERITVNGVSGLTLLHAATANDGNGPLVAALLSEGQNPDVQTNNGFTPMFAAIRGNDESVVLNLLLQAGADVNARNDEGESPLHVAARRLKPGLVRTLLEAGANPNRTNLGGHTALHNASAHPVITGWSTTKHEETVRTLLRAGADLNATTERGFTPLHIAANSFNPVAVEILLDTGADPNAKTDNEDTALHLVALYATVGLATASADYADEVVKSAVNTIESLTARGADLGAKDGKGRTPIRIAANARGTESIARAAIIIKALIESGASPCWRDADGWTLWDFVRDNPEIQGTDLYWRLSDKDFNCSSSDGLLVCPR